MLYKKNNRVSVHCYEGLTIDFCKKKNINFLQRNNQKVIAWTINDESEMRLLIERGVDGIMTDKILLLKKILIEQNKWK